MTADQEKRVAAAAAVAMVREGMIVGLGTGSTAAHVVTLLGARVADGLKVRAVATSEVTRRQAEGLGIPLVDLDDVDMVDLTIDGADEIDRQLRMIKGGGGALLREKLVAVASFHVATVIDSTKLVDRLGAYPLPIEIVPFGVPNTMRAIATIGHDFGLGAGAVRLRHGPDNKPYVTDQGNLILDAGFGRITDAHGLAEALDHVTGVVEHGLFLDIATTLVIGRGAEAEIITRGEA